MQLSEAAFSQTFMLSKSDPYVTIEQEEEPFKKRELFAVSLRRERKRDILAHKRKQLPQIPEAKSGDSVELSELEKCFERIAASESVKEDDLVSLNQVLTKALREKLVSKVTDEGQTVERASCADIAKVVIKHLKTGGSRIVQMLEHGQASDVMKKHCLSFIKSVTSLSLPYGTLEHLESSDKFFSKCVNLLREQVNQNS